MLEASGPEQPVKIQNGYVDIASHDEDCLKVPFDYTILVVSINSVSY